MTRILLDCALELRGRSSYPRDSAAGFAVRNILFRIQCPIPIHFHYQGHLVCTKAAIVCRARRRASEASLLLSLLGSGIGLATQLLAEPRRDMPNCARCPAFRQPLNEAVAEHKPGSGSGWGRLERIASAYDVWPMANWVFALLTHCYACSRSWLTVPH